jgi:predicted nucleotidyltransferase component of viral defense system
VVNRQEILEFAREFGLDPNVVEKDYILGWLLAGIGSHPDLPEQWVFKGGTCLKKCYFETYRFSEDLDFTLRDPDQLNEAFLHAAFDQVAQWVYEHSGIELPKEDRRFEIYQTPRARMAGEGRVGYRGPMRRAGGVPRVKLDLTVDEVLVLQSVERDVHHPYSDCPNEGIRVGCYAYEELFAEKVRALAERERPRDLYDVVHLYQHDEIRADRTLVRRTLEQKCAFKEIPVPTLEALGQHPDRGELESEWTNMLAHQLPALPPFAEFWGRLPSVFAWLFQDAEKPNLVAQPVPANLVPTIDAAWRPPSMGIAWHAGVPLEVIRFAAANRLCVDLEYDGTSRIIEPYSLRRTRDGNLLLFAVKNESGESRSYRVDRIEGAHATSRPFTPRFLIEPTAGGPINAPALEPRSSPRPASRSARTSRPLTGGRIYVIQCSYCGKKFNRRNYDTSLNPHKTKDGYSCPGRRGYLVETK